MPQTVKLLKASAGAGKTYRLTQEYIRLLLEGDESSYKHILAVTFTNKATEEMKSRIIKELYKLSQNTSSADCEAARSRLSKILNDYSCFSVSTIDRFFQSVMRAFAREIGQYASYSVELDTDAVVSHSVDMMMDSLSDPSNADLLEWLKEYSLHQIEDGASWSITKSLNEISRLFFKEDFKILSKDAPTIIEDKAAIKEFDAKLREIIKSFKERARQIGRDALKVMEDNGLEPDRDFKGKSRSPFMVFNKLAEGQIVAPKPTIYESFGGHDIPELHALVDELMTLFEDDYKEFVSAGLIRKNLYQLGIYSDLYKHLAEYLKENNVVLLSESTELLSRIIDGDDTPFIYEKTGLRYGHIMLDESQDTSRLQWQNFVPLFRENIAWGQDNLVVGDIKQSIYRWRGSDWRLMDKYIFEDLHDENIISDSMFENWRSCRNIVEFNNMLFSRAGDILGERVAEIYKDCSQALPDAHSSWPGGRVKVSFLDAEDWKDSALDRMYHDINQLLGAGYRCEDITVLVRTNVEGASAASYLMSKGLGVITEDSLRIDASDTVAHLLEILRHKANPDDPVSGLILENCLEVIDGEDIGGSLYETCESWLRNSHFEISPGDVPFVSAFLDCVISYQDKYGSSLRGFLKWWDESGCKKSICAPEGRDCVRIMTIHKSKGLGLEAVIIPFMEESFKDRNDTLWLRASGNFSQLGLVPIKSVKEMSESSFKDQYEDGRLLSLVDTVNTAYVALTRPVSQLIIYAPRPDKSRDFKTSSFANLVYSVLQNSLDENDTYISGELEQFAPADSSSEVAPLMLEEFFSAPIDDRLSLSLSGEDYFEEGPVSARRRGIELHEILSRVDKAEDLADACAGDSESYELLKPHLDKVASRHWFDGTYSSLKESSIVDASGSVHRPDRILTSDDASKAIVVDYKFGAQRQHYKTQISQYALLLREMGYRDVESYLWYVQEDLVVKNDE